MDKTEQQLQIILAVPISISFVFAILLPYSSYERYRTPALILCRFTALLMPSFKSNIKMTMQAQTALSKRWGHNRLGAIGLISFTSRGLILGVSSSAMPLDFVPTLLVQLLLGIASWPTDLGLCTAKIAAEPNILVWLNAIHSFFSTIWGICMPFFWTPLPPGKVVHPGVSFLAVTLFVQCTAAVLPVVQSVFREAKSYRKYLSEQQRHTRVQNSRSRDSRRNSSRDDGCSSDDDDDVDIDDYTIERYYRSRRRRRRNALRHIGTPHLINDTTVSNNVDISNGSNAFITSGAATEIYKRPPLAVRICRCYENVLHFPAHTVWIVVVSMSMLWTLNYKTAERMCR
jgi:hypothetical protein